MVPMPSLMSTMTSSSFCVVILIRQEFRQAPFAQEEYFYVDLIRLKAE